MAKEIYKIGKLARGSLDFHFDNMSFPLHNLSAKQAGNYLLSKVESRLRKVRPHSHPLGLQLEPTTVCQLDCPHCPRIKAIAGQEIGHMDFDKYQLLMEELGPYLVAMAVWQWGEPLLHPRISDIVKIAHDYNLITLLSTNAQVDLHSFDLESFMASGLDMLIISMDGVTQEVYQQFRQGGDLERVKEFVRAAVAIKQKLRKPTPIINVRTIATRDSEAEIPLVRDFAMQAGADVYSAKSITLSYDDDPDHPALPINKSLRSFQYRGEAERQAYKKLPNCCTKPWSWPTLRYDGTVLLCECDHTMANGLGNAFTTPFRDIWFSEHAAKLRENYPGSGKAGLEFCQRCRYKIDDGFPIVDYLREAVKR